MFQIWKMLLPKLYFSFADATGDGGAPSGQPAVAEPATGDVSGGDQPATNPTDFVDFDGVRVPADKFEKTAREKYKDAFDAQTNRDKWQFENTRRSQEIKALERDAEAFRRLQAEQINRPQPRNTFEAQKQAYVDKKLKAFPEVDPRFFDSQFDDIWEMSGARAQESMTPILERQSQEWEKKFLADHPLIQPQSEQYNKMVDMLERGYDPEDAYQIVFKKELLDQEFSARSKTADAERLKKLKGSPTGSQEGDKPMVGSRSEKIWRAMEKHGLSRES